ESLPIHLFQVIRDPHPMASDRGWIQASPWLTARTVSGARTRDVVEAVAASIGLDIAVVRLQVRIGICLRQGIPRDRRRFAVEEHDIMYWAIPVCGVVGAGPLPDDL